jgi:RNA polymerase sigma-32 factor
MVKKITKKSRYDQSDREVEDLVEGDDWANTESDNTAFEEEQDSEQEDQEAYALAPREDHSSEDGEMISSSALPPAAIQNALQQDTLKSYLRQIAHYKLLTPEEEELLTKKLFETGDVDVAKKLVVANLRLVVKIALEYRHAYSNLMDLIQEGNIGLMKAVSKYDPSKGAKLSYYASWWIKSYILKFILDNFRLIKVSTTNEQKKLFYNLLKEQTRLESMGLGADVKTLAENLGVSEKSVAIMQKRLAPGSGEVGLDQSVFADGRLSLSEILSDESEPIDDFLGNMQGMQILEEHLDGFVKALKPRDQEIFRKRLLSDMPDSLQSIADEYGVSRERIRQVEERLIHRLKVYMEPYLR